MKVLVIGAAGMVGRKLLEQVAASPDVLGGDIDALTLVDVIEPTAPEALASVASCKAIDLSTDGAAASLIAGRPDLIFHLAAVVSGEAEADFEKGYRVNLDGGRALLEAIRQEGQSAPYRPRLVFASSVAVLGAPFPEKIGDEFFATPLTSYGTQKAIMELLLADYARRGFLDGIGIRLPTICVRPGKPNAAASGFFSNIIREPLSGKEAVLPVDDSVRHWFVSPRSAVGFFTHAATLDLSKVGPRCNLIMPGLSATVAEQIAALETVAGSKAVSLIRREPDPVIEGIVGSWARDFDPKRALELGFTAEDDFEEIIRIHIDDELDGKIGA
ncbi:D-erythronate dehydrogenase [Tropicimonas isoalkanivorans]|uniref:Nucleoside-diphosphate-sugar epimerase n=1 Tax=Tropicimonas isoalkanivorans TaxID=441112 RepID=A0A1I1HS04_9RHOB|nr:D-erythronate dehydrogenase [Tropicimonas isoalkanivorans]SFC24748.1 Nucleoside-diphosphate-sugar epimerase [Tropicimonas isoalkanivorans]